MYYSKNSIDANIPISREIGDFPIGMVESSSGVSNVCNVDRRSVWTGKCHL